MASDVSPERRALEMPKVVHRQTSEKAEARVGGAGETGEVRYREKLEDLRDLVETWSWMWRFSHRRNGRVVRVGRDVWYGKRR